MDEETREDLLTRVNRQSATVGASLPDVITVGGDELELSEFLIETRRVEGVTPEERELVTEALVALETERKRLVERLETEEMAEQEGEELATTIVGIDRARNALENLRRPSYGEVAGSNSIEDHKRWRDFLDTIRD